MGPELALFFAVMSATSVGLSAYSQTKAAGSKSKNLEFEARQSKIRYQQEILSNYDILEKTLQSQQAEATTRGISFSSPSLQAIEMDSFNKAAKAEKNLRIEESLFQKNLKVEKKKVKDTLFTNLFGDVAAVGFDFAKYRSSIPKQGNK